MITDPEVKKVLDQLLIDIDTCLHGEGKTGATLRLMQNRIKSLLRTPEEESERLKKIADKKKEFEVRE